VDLRLIVAARHVQYPLFISPTQSPRITSLRSVPAQNEKPNSSKALLGMFDRPEAIGDNKKKKKKKRKKKVNIDVDDNDNDNYNDNDTPTATIPLVEAKTKSNSFSSPALVSRLSPTAILTYVSLELLGGDLNHPNDFPDLNDDEDGINSEDHHDHVTMKAIDENIR